MGYEIVLAPQAIEGRKAVKTSGTTEYISASTARTHVVARRTRFRGTRELTDSV
jgi:hypothetical protein